ncbi:S-layer homology domain-containing protein [Cohnella hongkongensis]|uniref:S-layer homology domain-containing protein n=1 Tax=Cohnella hongkongensis TaxID=178337 RepID=A0ABV9F644_9BACL
MKLPNRKQLVMLMVAILLWTAAPWGPEKRALASACDGVTPGTTADCPIMIFDAEGLAAMRNDLTAHYALGADIDLLEYLSPGGAGYNGGDGWVPIGAFSPFTGTFNGNGHTISHLRIAETLASVGLFGSVRDGTIRNVGLINVDVTGNGASSQVGGLVGYLDGSTVANSYVTGTVRGADYVGGLVGHAVSPSSGPSGPSQILNSYASAVVTSLDPGKVGGLVAIVEGDLNTVLSYFNSSLTESSLSGTPLTTAQMKSAGSFDPTFFAQGGWVILEGMTFPMHRTTLNQIELDELTIDDGEIAYEPAFAAHTSTYSSRVTSEADSVTVSVYSSSSRVSVSIGNEVGDSRVIELVPGINIVEITASTDVAVPGAATHPFEAVYTLHIIRENGADFPHRITTASQLAAIGNAPYALDDNYELMNDLDLTGVSWNPIGDGDQPFTGTFEGNRRVIRGLTVTGAADDAGLFAASSGTIRNIGLEDANVSGGSRVGGLVGSKSGIVSNAYVKGSVAGDEHVGGLVGLNNGAANVSYTYAAGLVSSADHTGGLIGENDGGSVNGSYWDAEIGGLAISAGGEGKTTADMQLAATYGGWDFAGTWAIMNGATYPMFNRHFEAVKLQALGATSTDAVLNWNSAVFTSAQGSYRLSADRYIDTVTITANPAVSDTRVTIGDAESASAQVAVTAGSHAIWIRTTGVNGKPDGAYVLTIDVPAPGVTGLDVPPAGYYGIGDALTFTVSYEGDVEVVNVPTIPVVIGEGADAVTVYAAYTGQPAGERNKLIFTYVVEEGLVHTNDIAIGTRIQLTDGAAIHAAATTVSVPLDLPAATITGIIIDSVRPEITLSQQPASTVMTNGPVTVTAATDGTGSDITVTKWSHGLRTADYFAAGGQWLIGDSFQATANGTYSVYAEDEAGNEAVAHIAISNIRSPSGSSGGGTAPEPAPERPIPPAGPQVTLDSSGGVSVLIDASSIVKDTLEDGTSIEHVVLTDELVEQVLDLLGDAQRSFVAVVIDDSGRAVQVQFPWGSLAKVKDEYPNAVFQIRLNSSSYQLQANALNPQPQTTHVNVVIAKAAGQEKGRLQQAANNAGLQLISDAVDAKVTDSTGGQTAEVYNLGSTYTIRTIVPNEGISGGRFTAVRYDPATRALSFVPAVTATRADGRLEISIKAPHNGIYAVMASGLRSFADLNGHWAKADVELLASKRIASGVSGTEFAPGRPITRAEFTALLVRALGLKIERTGSADFEDVSEEDWFAPIIKAGVEAGLVSGISKDEFAPGAPMTREQMAVMFNNAFTFLGYPEADAEYAPIVLDKFEDSADISAWAKSAVAQSVAAGIIRGTAGDAIAPSEATTRAQAVVMLRRFLKHVEFID